MLMITMASFMQNLSSLIVVVLHFRRFDGMSIFLCGIMGGLRGGQVLLLEAYDTIIGGYSFRLCLPRKRLKTSLRNRNFEKHNIPSIMVNFSLHASPYNRPSRIKRALRLYPYLIVSIRSSY